MALRTPEFLQTKTYSAMRDRLVIQHGAAQPGAWGATDFKVTQRAAGANMSVDVAAGFALVAANDPGNAGMYHIQNDASLNATLLTNGSAWPAGNASLPRIDSVYLIVNDTTDGGDSSDVPTVAIVQGTATSGATLDNRSGAGASPTGALLLADVLMPAAATTVTTANIRDRRPWARGVDYTNIQSGAGTFTSTFSGVTAQRRLEFSGGPMEVAINIAASNNTAGAVTALALFIDGAEFGGAGNWRFYCTHSTVNTNTTVAALVNYTLAAGSHTFQWYANASAGTSTLNNFGVASWSIRERLMPFDTYNS